ncbi:hypothetical protein [Methanorbis furvi]|uniref:Uncharacterized protein n=1 Tax=Methanorbis furvi TaxID=3028299 RepID=A0AAE4SB51_9EURY|nr:hypothetical protein [Methanocorpusculaceae archaeon Ag1]
MRPRRRDITGAYMRLRTELIKEYLAEGCNLHSAILYADADVLYVEGLGDRAINLFLEVPLEAAT